jgi:hypothetical protein
VSDTLSIDNLQPEDVATQLSETNPVALQQIQRALQVCGAEIVKTVLQETLDIEARGGMTLPDSDRRRTVGGVFFLLLRQRTDPEVWRQIRSSEAQLHAAPVLSLEWSERASVVQEALAVKGEIARVSITLQGRPTQIERQTDYVIATLITVENLPPLPKGVPTPPNATTTFKVCVPQREWSRVERALQSPQGQLRAMGYAIPNLKRQQIILFATKTVSPKSKRVEPVQQNANRIYAQVSIMGRVGKVVEQGTTVVLGLESKRAPKLSPEFEGLPPRTVLYTIYASAKQWNAIAAATPQEVWIDGYAFFDGETNTIAVLAKNVKVNSPPRRDR